MTKKSDSKKRKGVYLVIIDDTEECEKAIIQAAEFANAEDGYVALLYVIERVHVQNWQNVEDRVREEMRKKAEQMIWRAAGTTIEKTSKIPMVCIEEGEYTDLILKVIRENPNIAALVLAAAPSSNPGPLVSYFSGKGLSKLPVPLLIISDLVES